VTSYLERIDSGALVRRFGWLADHVQSDMHSEVRQRLMEFGSAARVVVVNDRPIPSAVDSMNQAETNGDREDFDTVMRPNTSIRFFRARVPP
jgi:predicted transcriptional regulator of viral defense system